MTSAMLEKYRLTSLQSAMLLHHRIHGADGTDIEQMIMRVQEEVDIPLFRRAWNHVAATRDCLRLRFLWDASGEPLFEVEDDVEIPCVILDWRSDFNPEDSLEEFLRDDRDRGFDLQSAPLTRVTLFQLGRADWFLVWTSHHLLFDGRSRVILLRELFQAYRSLMEESLIQSIQSPSFASYATWLHARNDDDPSGFWKRLFEGFTQPTPLPAARRQSPPGSRGSGRAHVAVRLSSNETDELRRHAEKKGVTANTLIQGAWALALSRYSGARDIVFGAVRACRDVGPDRVADMAGMVINTVPVRIQIDETADVQTWLEEIRNLWVEMRSHERTPLTRIIEQTDLPPGHPLFESLIAVEQYDLNEVLSEEEGFETGSVTIRSQTKFPLNLVAVLGSELVLELEYDREQFDDALVARFIGHLKHLLLEISGCGPVALADIHMLPERERRLLVTRWNDTCTEYPRDKTAWHVFREIAARQPEARALSTQDAVLTYSRLREKAEKIAAALLDHGVAAGDVVGIVGEQDPATVAGMLGIMAIGGVFLPLEPAYPAQRLSYMLQVSGARLVVGIGDVLDDFSNDHETLDLASVSGGDVSPGIPESYSDADSGAYILFTSGSTGTPKGIVLKHQALLRLVCNSNQLGDATGIVFGQLSTFSFDVSTMEVWGALLNGGELAIIPRMLALSPAELKSEMDQRGITTMILATSLFHVIAQQAPHIFGNLDTLLVGGEQILQHWVREVLRHGAPGRLINGYGPTETCYAAYFEITEIPAADERIPIGKAISNTTIYVLDDRLCPVPPGVEGELYIGSETLADGYISDEAQTREKFLPDPFADDPGRRMYRSGDRVVMRDDGNIVFLGRTDSQVKIRGYRIELGEIEVALRRLEGVLDAVCMVEPLESGDRLIGFVLVARGSGIDEQSVRRGLATELPTYMIPTRIRVLARFPLTENGKVDRSALMAAEFDSSSGLADAPRPTDGWEQRVRSIWMELFRREDFSASDDFFERGGDSLMALRLVSRLTSLLGHSVPVGWVFEHPTIASMSARLELVEEEGQTGRIDGYGHPITVDPASGAIDTDLILPRIQCGQIAPVDAAALSYYPHWLGREAGEKTVRSWYGDGTVVSTILDMNPGRIAILMLPLFGHELYEDTGRLIDLVHEAGQISREIGARAVSLTGLIPSATRYGLDLVNEDPPGGQKTLFTTGHAATAASVVLSVEGILAQTGRVLENETVAFLGLGSIGQAALELMLATLPHPPEIILCDLFGKQRHLEEVSAQIQGVAGFSGRVRVVTVTGDLPLDFYDASLIIGATNAPDVVDAGRLAPGTLIVDDSAPHCFSSEAAQRRLGDTGDILFTEGGALQTPRPINHLRYLPVPLVDRYSSGLSVQYSTRHPNRITSCVLSSFLCSHRDGPSRTLGHTELQDSITTLAFIRTSGFEAPTLHFELQDLSRDQIRRFTTGYGSTDTAQK